MISIFKNKKKIFIFSDSKKSSETSKKNWTRGKVTVFIGRIWPRKDESVANGRFFWTLFSTSYVKLPLKNGVFFGKSYYMSEHLNYDITYRELTTNFDYPDHENVLRAFTRFTYLLHENQINFLDHSPGNTLIKKVDDEYLFYLVDLNRMRFEEMTLEERVKNFAKLTIHDSMLEVMSDEYAHLMNTSKDKVFALMKHFTDEFQNKFHRKRRWKKRVLFWR